MSGNHPFEPPDVPERPDDLDDGEEGPIILPPGAACKSCHYSDVIRIGAEVRTVRTCRRFPPAPVFMPNAQGGVLTSSPPQVPDDYVCFEYDEKEGPALIPTGLG